ncbi:MAG TPA: TonB-dependent receptor [Longimicrobiales bacterium]
MKPVRFVGMLGTLFLTTALFAPRVAQAQDGTVTGVVIDRDTRQPLGGAQVLVVGTNQGALTNDEGRFLIPGVAAGPVTVQVVLLGYESLTQTANVTAGGTVTLEFALATSVVTLDELVVTATGQQRAREVANAVSTVDVGEIAELAPTTNIVETLAGQTPGVTLLQSSGTVGTSAVIKIRGNASISLDNTPLIYIDGVRVNDDNNIDIGVGGQTSSRLNDINPEDIARVEVIKGPAAAALYGTEASPGVIQIFTKRGRTGEARFNFRLGFGANVEPGTEYPDRYMDPRVFGFDSDTVYTMNLMEEFDPFRPGYIRSYSGNVSGGRQGFTYYVSGEYQTEDGVIKANGADRYYGRANVNIQADDRVDIGLSAGYTSNFIRFPQNDNNGLGFLGNAFLGLAMFDPRPSTDPVTGETIEACPFEYELAKANGISINDVRAALGPQCDADDGFLSANFDKVATISTEENTERFTSSTTVNWRPFDFLTNRFTLGYDQNAVRYKSMVPNDPERPFGDQSLGSRNIDNSVIRTLTLDYGGTINASLSPDFSSSTSFGVQFFKEVTEVAASSGNQFPTGAPSVGNAVDRDGDEDFVEERTIGFYVQEQIGWRDRLFFTPAIRLDDNSAFGQEADLAAYPKVGATYIISDEPWFPSGILDQLKLRVAWGRAGKQPGVFDALQRYSVVPVSLNETNVSGAYPLSLGNPDLKPEIGEEWEAGFDAGLLDGRLGLELTYYDKTTHDAIVLQDLAPSRGFPNPVFTNISEVFNSGLELGLNALAIDRPDFRWEITTTFSTNDNEIGPLDSPDIFGLGGSSQRHQEGFPFGAYFDRRVIIDPETGEPTFAADTAEYLGQPFPTWQSSVSTSMRLFDHITIYALLDIEAGHQLFNSTEEFSCGFLGGPFGSLCPATYERGPDGELTDEARIKQFAAVNGNISPWIEDADFAKLRTVSVQFDFPTAWAKLIGASQASFTLAGQELATWTDYSGLDPEINFAGQANGGRAEFFTLPRNRRFLGTLSVTF